MTVALSGDAGDELLGGYNRYVIGPQLWRAIAQCPPISASRLGLDHRLYAELGMESLGADARLWTALDAICQ